MKKADEKSKRQSKQVPQLGDQPQLELDPGDAFLSPEEIQIKLFLKQTGLTLDQLRDSNDAAEIPVAEVAYKFRWVNLSSSLIRCRLSPRKCTDSMNGTWSNQ